MRLGVFSDIGYRADGDLVSTHQPFARFLCVLAEGLEELRLFGRLAPGRARLAYAVTPRTRFVPLPYYASASSPSSLRVLGPTLREFERALSGLDAVLVFGPGIVANALARAALRSGTPPYLGVRQDYAQYIRHRRGRLAVAPALALEHAFRRLASRAPTIAVGSELAARYGQRQPLLEITVSLVGEDQIVHAGMALSRPWDTDRLELLTVTRLDAEKNPLLLVPILQELLRLEPRWHLTVVGDGPLRAELERRALQAGVSDRLTCRGHVESGLPLWTAYRSSHAFLHVSLTEGVPQVLTEAGASGLPLVATDVGGVRAALAGCGLLVRPRDAAAAAAALARIATDGTLRGQLIVGGIELARGRTVEIETERVRGFVRETLAAGTTRTSRARRRPLRRR